MEFEWYEGKGVGMNVGREMFKSSLACIVNNNITKKEVSVLISYSSSSSQGFQHLRVSCRSVISYHV